MPLVGYKPSAKPKIAYRMRTTAVTNVIVTQGCIAPDTFMALPQAARTMTCTTIGTQRELTCLNVFGKASQQN